MRAHFLVCEKTGSWATALRWAAGTSGLQLCELRNLLDCRDELAQHPASFLALAATLQNLEGVVRLLWEIQNLYPEAAAVVLADRQVISWEGLLREAGARHVTFTPRRLDLVIRMAERHLTAVSSPEQTVRELIWSRLPWKRV